MGFLAFNVSQIVLKRQLASNGGLICDLCLLFNAGYSQINYCICGYKFDLNDFKYCDCLLQLHSNTLATVTPMVLTPILVLYCLWDCLILVFMCVLLTPVQLLSKVQGRLYKQAGARQTFLLFHAEHVFCRSTEGGKARVWLKEGERTDETLFL